MLVFCFTLYKVSAVQADQRCAVRAESAHYGLRVHVQYRLRVCSAG